MDHILYDVKRWPALMYRMERQLSSGIRAAEDKGRDRSTRWNKVMEEGFACLLDPQTKRLDDPPGPGYEVEQTALDQMTGMTEFRALQEYTRGDEQAAGQAIACLARAVADRLVPQESGQDVDALRDELETLQELAEQGVPVEVELGKAEAALAQALQEQQELASGIDPVGIRIAVRHAARRAAEEIEQERAAVAALSWSSDPGTPVNRTVSYREDAARLRQSGKLQQIAMEAGRQRALACRKQAEKVEEAKVEVDSIEAGDELSRMLGSELMLLVSDDELEQLMFLQRYADRQCLQYRLSGKEEKQQGPIVFVIDTSGSQNPYEIVTKATVLAMLDVARLQKRSFGIVWFSSNVNRVDYLRAGEDVKTAQIMNLLQHWTGGGTNFQVALERAVQLIRDDGEYKQADVVLVTDGYCHTGERWDEAFLAAKQELGVAVYSVLTRADYLSTVRKWSDQIWPIDDLQTGRVQETIYAV